MLVTPHDVMNFTPRLSPRAEQYEGMRRVFRICPRSSSGSAFPIESGSDFPDFPIGINLAKLHPGPPLKPLPNPLHGTQPTETVRDETSKLGHPAGREDVKL
jgi:hypothetical protein